MANGDIDYDKLAREFSLLRRPYISLAQSIERIESDARRSDKLKNLSENIKKGFDFYLFNINRYENNEIKYFFRWLPGFDESKFKNIITIANTDDNIFKKKVNEIIKSTKLDDLTKFYKEQIEKGISENNKLNYILAVYHLTYWVNVPLKDDDNPLFLSGITHSSHINNDKINKGCPLVDYRFHLEDDVDNTDYQLPKVKILDNSKRNNITPQVTDEFSNDNGYKSFFNKWINSILLGHEEPTKNEKINYKNYPYLIFFPVYDGYELHQGYLRGYLGIYCKVEENLDSVKKYIEQNFVQIQSEINKSFIKGAHNDILDRYMSLKDPIEHWYDNLFRLHNWDNIEWKDSENLNNEIWYIQDNSVCINLDKVLKRSTVIERPSTQHRKLKLSFPMNSNIFLNISVENNNPYIENRVAEIISLLDDILVRWQVLKQSTKSAISAVMSRNMSHNIGSHVLASLIQENQIESHLAKSFLKYIQTRMEFIADIITTETSITFPANLEKDVIEKFLSYSNALRCYIPEYLLRFISGSREVTLYLSDTTDKTRKNIDVIIEDDSYISLPNDLLGAQAFYVILENIIRNSTKHSKIPNENGRKLLKFTIKKDENFNNDDLYKFIIWDNLGKENSDFRGKSNFEIGNQKVDFKEWMNHKINRPVLDSEGKLRQNDWGMLEMKICAAYLRKSSLIEIDYEQINTPLLNIVLDQENNIGYELYLLKPKLACIILNQNYNCIDNDKLKKFGIDIELASDVVIDELYNYGYLVKKDGSLNHRTSHQYLFIDENINTNSNNIPQSNQQYKFLDKNAICKLLNGNDFNIIHSNILSQFIESDQIKKLTTVDASSSDSPNDIKDNLIFDDHGQYKDKHINSNKWLEDIFYYEKYSSQSPTNQLLSKWERSNNGEKLKITLEFNLAARLTVGILDERIQAQATNDDEKIRKVLNDMKIFVPSVNGDEGFDLYANSFQVESNSKTIAKKIRDWLEKYKNKYDYLIIHQGIIEKTLNKTDQKDIEGFIEEFNECKAQIIIISGRGKPSNLPNNVLYLPFSLVNQYVMTYRSKIYLYKLLISARRYRNG